MVLPDTLLNTIINQTFLSLTPTRAVLQPTTERQMGGGMKRMQTILPRNVRKGLFIVK